jgi:hypothetical protein
VLTSSLSSKGSSKLPSWYPALSAVNQPNGPISAFSRNPDVLGAGGPDLSAALVTEEPGCGTVV